MISLTVSIRIIQDCEDALTTWVAQNAAVRSNLSQRSQNLSRLQHRSKGSARDHDSAIGSWVPASEHLRVHGGSIDEVEGEEGVDDDGEEPDVQLHDRDQVVRSRRMSVSPTDYYRPSKGVNDENVAPATEKHVRHSVSTASSVTGDSKRPTRARRSAATPLREVA